MRSHSSSRSIFLLAIVATTTSLAQDSASDSEQKRADKRYELFLEKAKDVKLATAKGDDLVLNEVPLMKYTRDGGKRLGSVLLWTNNRRPAAIGTIGCIPSGGVSMFAELHWLLKEPMRKLQIGRPNPKNWEFDGSQPDFVVPSAPVPTSQPATRLIQMRRIAEEFRGKMTEADRTHELRLLPQPLFRYQESTKELDGAIFAMVWTEGTDPELLLHIFTSVDAGKPTWGWQPIRFTWRPLELHHKDTQVWQSPEFATRDSVNQSGPYITTIVERIVD